MTTRKTREPARAQGTRRAGQARGYPSDLTDAQWRVIAAHTTRDYEHLPASHEAMILWAMIALMTRRLAQPAQ